MPTLCDRNGAIPRYSKLSRTRDGGGSTGKPAAPRCSWTGCGEPYRSFTRMIFCFVRDRICVKDDSQSSNAACWASIRRPYVCDDVGDALPRNDRLLRCMWLTLCRYRTPVPCRPESVECGEHVSTSRRFSHTTHEGFGPTAIFIYFLKYKLDYSILWNKTIAIMSLHKGTV